MRLRKAFFDGLMQSGDDHVGKASISLSGQFRRKRAGQDPRADQEYLLLTE